MTESSDLSNIKQIHFIGIYGISLSSLALLSARYGYRVSGSDTGEGNDSRRKALTDAGIRVFRGNSPDNLPRVTAPEQVAVVYTAAVTEENAELSAARRMGMRILARTELMELLTGDIPVRIGIAGTHGKSTVCGMVSRILIEAGLDPDVLCGAELPFTRGALRIGGGKLVVYEACEYKNSFLRLRPTHAVITNIEEDHPDFFKDIGEIRDSFFRYADAAPAVTVCVDGEESRALAEQLGGKAVTCSISDESAEYFARDVRSERGRYSFTLHHGGQALRDVRLRVIGKHNLQNAVTAAAVALENGASPDSVRRGLELFDGVKRRMEYRGTLNGAVIYDDYAHHPTEIRATLSAARSMGFKRVICAFQPHTYSRTAKLFHEFTESFGDADRVIFADIYAAREVNTYGIHSRDLAAATEGAVYIPTVREIAEYFSEIAAEGVLLITMGAGELDLVCDMLLKNR